MKYRGKLQDMDAEIGQRIREARLVQCMSQTALGDRLGITFQQIRKYEKGGNRVSAARLFDIAHILRTPIIYFYEG